MEHKIIIWSKSKETGKSFRVETHLSLSQEKVEELALNEYIDNYSIDEEKEYWAEIDKTIH